MSTKDIFLNENKLVKANDNQYEEVDFVDPE